MKKNFYLSLGIFISLAASRFIPHPPNFTSLLALTFYVPTLMGIRFLPVLILSFAITDFFIGYHNLTHWTWGSIFIVSLLSIFLKENTALRLIGATTGVVIFFLITNFGVWSSGMYGYNFSSFIKTYLLAIPFFVNNLVSTFVFSIIIEIFFFFFKIYLIKNHKIKLL